MLQTGSMFVKIVTNLVYMSRVLDIQNNGTGGGLWAG